MIDESSIIYMVTFSQLLHGQYGEIEKRVEHHIGVFSSEDDVYNAKSESRFIEDAESNEYFTVSMTVLNKVLKTKY